MMDCYVNSEDVIVNHTLLKMGCSVACLKMTPQGCKLVAMDTMDTFDLFVLKVKFSRFLKLYNTHIMIESKGTSKTLLIHKKDHRFPWQRAYTPGVSFLNMRLSTPFLTV